MISRRKMVSIAGGAAMMSTPALSSGLVLTPRQGAGPFFPDVLPPETDTDLTMISDRGQAAGEVIEVYGQLLGLDGRAISGAAIHLWQANTHGRYAHTGDQSSAPLDPNFQGYGVAVTDNEGRYRFKTIKPGLYTGRARHIHFAATGPGFEQFTTQLYFAGDPSNEGDSLYKSLGARAGMLTTKMSPNAVRGVMDGQFDIVVDTRE